MLRKWVIGGASKSHIKYLGTLAYRFSVLLGMGARLLLISGLLPSRVLAGYDRRAAATRPTIASKIYPQHV